MNKRKWAWRQYKIRQFYREPELTADLVLDCLFTQTIRDNLRLLPLHGSEYQFQESSGVASGSQGTRFFRLIE
jgi:hypothetical protein